MAPITRSAFKVAYEPTALRHYNIKVELNKNQKKSCMLCGRKEISNMLYGSLYMLNDVIVHHFCIMLSSQSVKSGGEKEGIFGYLLNDIIAQITQGSKLTCVYCNKKGATLSCVEFKCQKRFHLPCGLKNGSMHHYIHPFYSFCQQHRVLPIINVTELSPFAPPTVECTICNDDVITSTSPTSIWVPCCSRNSWFHTNCVQDLALRKGYFIECPKCGNVDKFKSRLLNLGIYIPSLYATWQNRRRLTNSLAERTIQCDAAQCLCPYPDNRNYQDQFRWQLVLCKTCGFRASHVQCGSYTFNVEWNCSECRIMISNIPARRLEFPIEGNAVGISAVMGDLDSNGILIRNHHTQQYTPGYAVKIYQQFFDGLDYEERLEF